MFLVIENFLDAKKEREVALKSEFTTISHNGLTYPGLSLCQDQESSEKIASLIGLPSMSAEIMYRYYGAKMDQETFIHSDVLISSYTAIVFLSERKSHFDGLAFWRHKEFGWSLQPISKEETQASGAEWSDDFWRRIWKDGLEKEKWEMIKFVPMLPGRMVLFDSRMYHSRFPKEQTAEAIEDARLIKVFFCR